MANIFLHLFNAITVVFKWFTDLYSSVGALNLIIALTFIMMICRFLLYPFFSGVINVGVSDAVQAQTKTGKYSLDYKNRQNRRKSTNNNRKS